jgi:hypothetical protein
VQQTIGPIALSEVYRTTDIEVDDLPFYTQEQVRDTINADSVKAATAIVKRLGVAVEPEPTSTPTPTPTPSVPPAPEPPAAPVG